MDPATVAGVYGGAGASGGLFAGDTLLPLLTTISHATAEQALALIGVQTPKPGSAAATTTQADATSAKGQAILDQAGASGSGAMNTDPLWGRPA